METDYKVKLEIFDGPLDLLLYLVKKDEIDIYDVSIERITGQYLAYMQLFKILDLEVAGEFVLMAANLIYLKSRSLLPASQQPPEESAEEDDPRWELVRQLLEYKKFKDAAVHLHQREVSQENLFGRVVPQPDFQAERPLGELSIFDILGAFQNVLKRLNARENLREIFEENFSVSDKIELILKLSAATPRISFDELFGSAATRPEVVVTFLALLELIRLKQLRVLQDEQFGEIFLERLSQPAFAVAP